MSFLEHLISFMHVPPAGDHPAELTGLRERVELYGNPGLARTDADPAWVKRNIVEFHGSQALPGIPSKFYFQTHRLAVPHLRRALERAQRECPTYVIGRAASFVFRRQRHDTPALAAKEKRRLRPLSEHAWGLAVDIDPYDDADQPLNGARTFARGAYPEPWGPAWMKLWPKGLPRAFVAALEAEGWAWGGRWQKYCDPMHFSWSRRP
ncbi:MAG: M15 family metallopeptidase [Tessaracoccus sp.]|uniref:M15 family metallopeptidase n=1 Tax=Tessaracoccus sp. TaxID=1971211 RepID=UPI001EB2CA63|nr:M15 family metallopeptidase [Tessaracoccus sp.]MBK7823082.1 M15 family metallopeptidase [Tessaracoccus sp.]